MGLWVRFPLQVPLISYSLDRYHRTIPSKTVTERLLSFVSLSVFRRTEIRAVEKARIPERKQLPGQFDPGCTAQCRDVKLQCLRCEFSLA